VRKLCHVLKTSHDRLTETIYWLGILCLSFILAMFCYEIVARYFFRSPSRWISDYTGYALLFSTFFLAPRIARFHGHIQVSFVQEALRGRAKSLLGAALFLMAAGACAWAGWYAVEEATRQYARNIQTMAAVSVPKWWMSAAIAYGFLNSMLYYLRHSVAELRTFPDAATA